MKKFNSEFEETEIRNLNSSDLKHRASSLTITKKKSILKLKITKFKIEYNREGRNYSVVSVLNFHTELPDLNPAASP